MEQKEKKRPETGARMAECPVCKKRVNARWIPNGICIYCRWDGVKE